MLRFFISLALLFSMLNAKGKDSCYTVQLKSSFANEKNKKTLEKETYPSSCQLMQISNSLTVRCGCYDTIEPARQKFYELKGKYSQAAIATTYKYRFANSITPNTTTPAYTAQDEELKLMLQSFLYVNDLDNAYKTAQIGYKKHPNSFYWNQKMAEISQWTGRGSEAVKYMTFMYSQNHDKKLQSDIINYGLKSYQYDNIEPLVVVQAMENPTDENIDKMIFIHSEIGLPERSVKILLNEYEKHPDKTIYLTKSLQIYLDMGELELAGGIVKQIEKTTPYSVKDAQLISYYYYLKKDMHMAYSSLLLTDKITTEPKYYELLSDLGWYLQKYKPASNASVTLYKMNKARLVDFERIALMQKKNDLPLVSKSSTEAYQKYNASYIFYGYANYSLKFQKFDELNARINELDTKNSKLADESQYWLIKAQLYTHYGKDSEAIKALNKALELNKNSIQIQLTILYFYIDHGFNNELELALNVLAQNKNLSDNFYFPLASSYFYIQDINRASYFVDKVIEKNLSIVNNIDFKFLQAYIYQTKNNKNAFIQKMYEIQKQLDKASTTTPALLKNAEFLNNYLNASINISSSDKFLERLQKAKPYLKKDTYQRLQYNLATKNREDALSNSIYQKIEKKDLWLRFSNALLLKKHSEIGDLLDAYLKLIALSDASVAAYSDGQTALAQTLTYEALSKNDDSQNAYIAHMNLSSERTDLFTIKPAYYLREPLLQKYLALENRTYLSRDWYLYSTLNFYNNQSTDTQILRTVPKTTLGAGVSIKKVFARAYIDAQVLYHNSISAYLSYKLSGEYKLNRYFKGSASIAKNIDAQESTQLLLGGKKDLLELKLLWTLFPSTSLEFLLQHNEYNSQDNIYLGSGEYARSILSYQIKNGYPDMRVSGFVDAGVYDETEGTRGDIDILQNPNQAALPENFYNVGVNFAYGMVNSKIYTRVWRPYFELSSYYNSFSQNVNFGIDLGYGGKVNAQDHLVVGANYTESVNGIGGSIFELFLRYEFLYISY